MSQEQTKVVTVAPGFFTLLGLLFIGLKLGGVINWSWWLVLLPLYGGLLLFLAIFVVAFIVIGLIALCKR